MGREAGSARSDSRVGFRFDSTGALATQVGLAMSGEPDR